MISHILNKNIIACSFKRKSLMYIFTQLNYFSTDNTEHHTTFAKELKNRLAQLGVESAKSSGPGGQNVNKRKTKIRLKFNIGGCSWLSEQAKQKLERQEGNRINKDGMLIIECQEYRTREQNHDKILKIFKRMLELANETEHNLSKQTVLKLKKRKSYLQSKARSARKHRLIAEKKQKDEDTNISEKVNTKHDRIC